MASISKLLSKFDPPLPEPKYPNMKWQRAKEYLLSQTPWICGLCQKEILNRSDLNIDHIRPKSKGGGNRLHNLQLAHVDCNKLKGNKL